MFIETAVFLLIFISDWFCADDWTGVGVGGDKGIWWVTDDSDSEFNSMLFSSDCKEILRLFLLIYSEGRRGKDKWFDVLFNMVFLWMIVERE